MGTEMAVRQDQQHRDRLLQLAIRREIARTSDDISSLVQEPAEIMAQAPKLDITQVRNLENLAYCTDKVSDITDLLKQQIGRPKSDERWRFREIGDMVMAHLATLRARAGQIVESLGQTEHYQQVIDNDLVRRIHLELCREYVKHLTAEYLYRKQ